MDLAADFKKYAEIVKHYEECLDKFGDSHLGVDWPNHKDAQTRYQVMLDVIKNGDKDLSLLDLGCGAAHLYEVIQKCGIPLQYSGLDMSKKFISLCKDKYPDVNFYKMDILEESDKLPEFDYIIANGVFTEKRSLEFGEMLEYFKDMIRLIFSKCRKGIAFNVMSTDVDWERDELFHLSNEILSAFLESEISRNYTIRNDYGLFEYTVYVYK